MTSFLIKRTNSNYPDITLKILYIGSLNQHSNSYRRYLSLKNICTGVSEIDTDPYLLVPLFGGLQYHYSWGPGIIKLNRDVRKLISNNSYDIILVDNKPYLFSRTLKKIKKHHPFCKISNLITDDPFGLYAKSWGLSRKTAALYDIIFVQRSVNVEEFKRSGAKNVALCYRSFDPLFNRPLVLDESDREKYEAEIGFVGTYESYRAAYISFLIEKGIRVSVTGDGWENKDFWNIVRPYYRGPSVYGEEYIKTINGMKVALHFLRHANRDEQDSRTFEIPACGVFMLAESSTLQKQLFIDGEEAVFFETKEELLEKVNYYLIHIEERKRIALNGYKRCLESGYSHQARMENVLSVINYLPA